MAFPVDLDELPPLPALPAVRDADDCVASLLRALDGIDMTDFERIVFLTRYTDAEIRTYRDVCACLGLCYDGDGERVRKAWAKACKKIRGSEWGKEVGGVVGRSWRRRAEARGGKITGQQRHPFFHTTLRS